MTQNRSPRRIFQLALCAFVAAGCGENLPGAVGASGAADAGIASADVVQVPLPPQPMPVKHHHGAVTGNAPGNGAAPTVAPTAVWYLNVDGQRLTVTLGHANAATQGSVLDENSGVTMPLMTSTAKQGALTLSWQAPDARWDLQATVRQAVLMGHVQVQPADARAPIQRHHVTGWNATALDAGREGRVFDLLIGEGLHAVLRFDRTVPRQALTGFFKIYASVANGAQDEDLQYPVTVTVWDGTQLAFQVAHGDATWTFSGVVAGRLAAGACVLGAGVAPLTWTGERAEVLALGLAPLTGAALDSWQAQIRTQLKLLMMAGDPAPKAMTVTVLQDHVPPTTGAFFANRDDDGANLPQAWLQSELQFDMTLADPAGGPDLTRRAHAWLAKPTTPVPQTGWPTVIALNGHFGAAQNMLTPGDTYWYGDAFARRGFAVLALDIGHRPVEDRADLYADWQGGDDPTHGNGLHPAIHADGRDSDWEEDGERVWDVVRAIDYLASQNDLDLTNLQVTGLSMGGEVSTEVAALDPRVQAVIVAGYSPDLNVTAYHTNHPCWQWRHGNIREFVSMADFQAQIAPRPLTVETGRVDGTFSAAAIPYAADKQVVARTALAYAAAGAPAALHHYLHPDAHAWHAATAVLPDGISLTAITAPTAGDPVNWQLDPATIPAQLDVFGAATVLGAPPPGP